jgi:SAM-dependent methyltransferase
VTGTGSPPGPWADGDQYEHYVGRWSRLVARAFVTRLAVPAGRRWLDVGCGTGALTQEVLAAADPVSVIGVDPAPAFLAHAAAHLTDPRVQFRAGTAQALPVADGAVDAVVSGLVLNFVPDAAAALAEMCRVTAAGGTVALYVWDYAEGMELIRRFWDAAVDLDPDARDLDEGVRFPLCRPERLHELCTAADLHDVAVGEIVVPTVFTGFDDFWTPFLGGTGPAPSHVEALGEQDRAALREVLRSRIPTGEDGSIHLTARAWSVRGRR